MTMDHRQTQAASWAFRSVAEGIEHFKEGRHAEAFQCLNKALSIDPRNVEGLVARGALYANNGSFKKAVDDFENALELNPAHANARKYMGETLVALGRSYEDDNKIEEAKKAYQDCLKIIPLHEEAQNSLSFLRTKVGAGSKQLIELDDLNLPPLNIKIAEQNRGETSRKDSIGSDSRKEKKSKKKKSKNRKRHSSSSSSTDSSDSSESSSGNSSSSSESSSSSDSDRSKSKKKRKRSEKSHRSQSPFTKYMASYGGRETDVPLISGQNFPAGSSTTNDGPLNDYELRVSKFLEMTRDDDNYEEKVRKFVEEASKYQKGRKLQEEKLKKKEKKRSKKAKKDSKKKKKEKKSKSNKKDKDDLSNLDNMEFREALKIFTKLPIFDTKKIEDVEKTLNQLKEEERKLNGAIEPKPQNDTKWKMIFSKDNNKETAPISKQSAFSNDDEQELSRRSRSPENQEIAHEYNKRDTYQRSLPTATPLISTAPIPTSRPYFADAPPAPPPVHLPNLGPSVLDKFGNFRRAEPVVPFGNQKPPEVQNRGRSKSHSRSRSRSYSRSRSRSYSRRSRSRSRSKRRSRSRSYGGRRSRSVSRRRSRSYSRSRSRSGSLDPRERRRWQGGTYYRPRFNNNRGRFQRGGYRDFRNRGRDRYNRGFGWAGPRNRYRSRDRFNRRSRSGSRRSYSPDRKHSPTEEQRKRNDRKSPPPLPPTVDNGDNVRPMKKQVEGDPSVEEIQSILDKAKRDNKEEMLERNKDLAKKA